MMKFEDLQDIHQAWQRFAEIAPLPMNIDQRLLYWIFCQGAAQGIGVLSLKMGKVAQQASELEGTTSLQALEIGLEAIQQMPLQMEKFVREINQEAQRVQVELSKEVTPGG